MESSVSHHPRSINARRMTTTPSATFFRQREDRSLRRSTNVSSANTNNHTVRFECVGGCGLPTPSSVDIADENDAIKKIRTMTAGARKCTFTTDTFSASTSPNMRTYSIIASQQKGAVSSSLRSRNSAIELFSISAICAPDERTRILKREGKTAQQKLRSPTNLCKV
jgi:hypothetical protein